MSEDGRTALHADGTCPCHTYHKFVHAYLSVADGLKMYPVHKSRASENMSSSEHQLLALANNIRLYACKAVPLTCTSNCYLVILYSIILQVCTTTPA